LEPGEIVAFSLNTDGFHSFLLDLTQESLYENSDVISVFKKSARSEGYIRAFGLSRRSPDISRASADEMKSGYYRIGAWPVYTEFIDFMNNADNFKQILLEQKIENELLNYAIMAHTTYVHEGDGPPPPGNQPQMCIWLHTDKGDYFLDHNPYIAESHRDPNFTFDFYTLDEYRQKYGKQ